MTYNVLSGTLSLYTCLLRVNKITYGEHVSINSLVDVTPPPGNGGAVTYFVIFIFITNCSICYCCFVIAK